MKRLSQLEATELFTIHRNEPNRFVSPRYSHLIRRGLIVKDNGRFTLTDDGKRALERFTGMRL